MPRVRNGGQPENTYQWPNGSPEPSHVEWTPGYNNMNFIPDPPKGVPDVPLNVVDHRYCTPPPMDPRYIDPPVGPKDDFPPHLGRAPSPDDFDELTGARPPLAPPGSIHNPLIIEDDEDAKRYRKSQQSLGPPPGLENYQPTQTSRQYDTGNKAQSSSSSSSPSKAGSSTRTSPRNSRAAPAVEPEPPVGQARFRKTAADGFTPKTSSPLKKVAYKASSKRLPSPPPPPAPAPSRWDIPPRKHSVTVSSVCSSDSEYSDD